MVSLRTAVSRSCPSWARGGGGNAQYVRLLKCLVYIQHSHTTPTPLQDTRKMEKIALSEDGIKMFSLSLPNLPRLSFCSLSLLCSLVSSLSLSVNYYAAMQP